MPAGGVHDPPFVAEITILQRERNPDIPQALWLIGCLVVLFCTLTMIAGITWGGGRINTDRAAARARPSCSRPRRHDDNPDVVILADHSLLLAVPAFAPAIVVAGVVVYIAVQEPGRSEDQQ